MPHAYAVTGETFALITGASRGIGAALAEALASEGHNLIVTARSRVELEALACKLARPGVVVHSLAADLNTDGAEKILAAITAAGWVVDLLVNNAGLGYNGGFVEADPARVREQLEVNVLAAVVLCRGLVPGMRERGRGAIVNVASTAAFQPVPYMSVYAATKAFLLQFSLGLREELRGTGVTVMALCPGPTRTGFFAVAGSRPHGKLQTPEQVAAMALRGLGHGKAVVVCGAANRVMAAAAGCLPRSWMARAAGRVVKGWQAPR